MLALESNIQIASATKSSWPHLDRNKVLNRLEVLKENPDAIEQGALGLCGEAAFYYHVLQRDRERDPRVFFSMGQTLFLDGECVLGRLLINPRSKLLNADYAAIVAAYLVAHSNETPMPPQCDWMLLSALRDSANELLPYEGNPDQSAAEGSYQPERRRWYQRTELYESVYAYPAMPAQDVVAVVDKTESNHIAMDLDQAMLRPGATGAHVVSLESPLVFQDVEDPEAPVTFQYWSWGKLWDSNELFPAGHILTGEEFSRHFLGAIVATYER